MTIQETQAIAIQSILTGFLSGTGTVSSSDTILQAIQKLSGNILTTSSSANLFNSYNFI